MWKKGAYFRKMFKKMRKNVRKKTKNAHKCAQMRTKYTWQDQK
jgi:hypothetical protein